MTRINIKNYFAISVTIKSIFLFTGLSLLILGIISVNLNQDAYATMHPRPTYTYYIVPNELANKTLVQDAASYWSQYGFTFKYSANHPSTIIEFHKYCMGDVIGQINMTSHKIDIYAYCHDENSHSNWTKKIVTHELGHLLGFEHTSDPPVMRYSMEEPPK